MSLNKLMSASPRLILLIALIVLSLTAFAGGSAAAKEQKNPRAEDVAERVINAYGGRAALYAIQRNGILRGQITLTTPEGKREGKTTTKFIRKPRLLDDLLLIDLDLAGTKDAPGTKFMVGFDGKQTWTINNGETQEPTPETANAFRAAQVHSYEALLRYKENNSKLEYVGSKKLLDTLEYDILDLVTPEGARTRYEISRRTGHIMYLDYEQKVSPQGPPLKYRLYFKDFRVIQNTLVPFNVLVFENGRQVEDRKLVEVAFNVQLEEKAFLAENANKPAEAAARP